LSFLALDYSADEISDCSSIEDNANDATVVNQKASSSDQPLPQKRKRAAKILKRKGNKGNFFQDYLFLFIRNLHNSHFMR
jgi:hypothetical protein